MTTTSLYLCAAHDVNGDALDLIVEAADAEAATDLWLAYIAEHSWNPVRGLTHVYELPALSGSARPYDWQSMACQSRHMAAA